MNGRKRRTPIALALVLGLLSSVLMATAALAEPHPGNPGGNCDGFNGPFKVDVPQDFDANGEAIIQDVPIDGTDPVEYMDVVVKLINPYTVAFFDTDGNELVVEFCVKASNTNSGTQQGHEYSVDFTNPGDENPEISNIVVYLVLEIIPPEEVPEGEWCSPGFWRNSPVQAAAAAAIVEANDAWPEGVSLANYKHILDNPQIYGGELFNAVGDALSAAAGLEWTTVDGERPEDSCPFSSDRSKGGTKFSGTA